MQTARCQSLVVIIVRTGVCAHRKDDADCKVSEPCGHHRQDWSLSGDSVPIRRTMQTARCQSLVVIIVRTGVCLDWSLSGDSVPIRRTMQTARCQTLVISQDWSLSGDSVPIRRTMQTARCQSLVVIIVRTGVCLVTQCP
ncbi:hypothetical protein ACOMHN_039349 [Nucella lapillus]